MFESGSAIENDSTSRLYAPRPVPLPEREWLLPGSPFNQLVRCRDGTPARIVAGPGILWHRLANNVQQGDALDQADNDAIPGGIPDSTLPSASELRHLHLMLRVRLSDIDNWHCDEVVHRLGVLRPDLDVGIEDMSLVVRNADEADAGAVRQLVHDQFLHCRIAAQSAELRSRLYSRLLG